MLKRFPAITGGRLIFVVTACIVVYFLGMFAANAIRTQQLNEQEDRLIAEIEEMQTRYERLKALEQYLSSDEYVEAIAREQLGLVKPGETAYIAISTQPTPTPVPGAASDLWWENLIR